MKGIYIIVILALSIYIIAEKLRQKKGLTETDLRKRERTRVLFVRALRFYPGLSPLEAVCRLRRGVYDEIYDARKQGKSITGLVDDLVLLINKEHELHLKLRSSEESFTIVGDMPVVPGVKPDVYEQQRQAANE